MDYEKIFAEMDAMIETVRNTKIEKLPPRKPDSRLWIETKEFFANAAKEAEDNAMQMKELKEEGQKLDQEIQDRMEAVAHKEIELAEREKTLEMARKLAEVAKNP